jgi:hypothetical protein
MEIIVDCYSACEAWSGYLDGKLEGPFAAKCSRTCRHCTTVNILKFKTTNAERVEKADELDWPKILHDRMAGVAA